MAVANRVRFEVLRRDGHRCYYCGATAQDAKLTVDHVIPQALGGTDEPSNLVTACEACNNGKASVPADASVVTAVADDAMRWAAAMQQAAENSRAAHQERLAYRETFRTAWETWGVTAGRTRTSVPLDAGWEHSIDNFREAGLPEWELAEGITVAMTRNKIGHAAKFKYFCGICWTKVRKIQEDARAIVGSDAAPARSHPERYSREYRDEQQRVSDAVTSAWTAKRAELGRAWTEDLESNISWQAGSWWARGVTERELVRAAEVIAERAGMGLAGAFGADMSLLSAMEQYYAACERLHSAAFNESSQDRPTIWALMEMLQSTFETVSRAVHRLAEVAQDEGQVAILREVALWMTFPRDRIYDLFPMNYPFTWDEHNQVEWPAVMWTRWRAEDAVYPQDVPAWCGSCDGPALHHRWRPIKVDWFDVERTILAPCQTCNPSMQPPDTRPHP